MSPPDQSDNSDSLILFQTLIRSLMDDRRSRESNSRQNLSNLDSEVPPPTGTSIFMGIPMIFRDCPVDDCEECSGNGPTDTSNGVPPASQGNPPTADEGRSPLDKVAKTDDPMDTSPIKDSIIADFQGAGNESHQFETSPTQDVQGNKDSFISREDERTLIDSTVRPNAKSLPGSDVTDDGLVADSSEGAQATEVDRKLTPEEIQSGLKNFSRLQAEAIWLQRTPSCQWLELDRQSTVAKPEEEEEESQVA